MRYRRGRATSIGTLPPTSLLPKIPSSTALMTSVNTPLAPLSFDSLHEDVIHDAQFDYYGKRLATASSDRTIKVFQVEPGQGERLLATLTGHEGPVWQVAWAHPKYGGLLASCSYDGAVIIWKESAGMTAQPPRQQQFGFQQHQQPQVQSTSWTKLKEHRLHGSSVNAIAWAPHELGLSLACASSDGQLSILTYRIEDSSWEVKAFPAHQIGCNAVSWCPSPNADYLASLVTGSKPAPSSAKRLVSGGCDNAAKIWCWNEAASEWSLEATLEGHSDWVRDVAWSSAGGNTIATCSQDRAVFIWTSNSDGTWSKAPLTQEPFPDTIWRMSWSTSGNLLAVSCGDNTVSVWRESPTGSGWEQISKADQASMAQLQ